MKDILRYFLTEDFFVIFTVVIVIVSYLKKWHVINFYLFAVLAISLFLFSFIPFGGWVLASLENQYLTPKTSMSPYGVIILGGAIDPIRSESNAMLSINSSGERLYEGVLLAKKFQNSRVLILGLEAPYAKKFFVNMGIREDRIDTENTSRNTFENVTLGLEKAEMAKQETWLLVTSARHMMRAMAVFKKFQWNVIPHPVDYQKPSKFNYLRPLDEFRMLRVAMREYLATAYYLLKGWIEFDADLIFTSS
tara:strand:+ start:127 stop:876 length:750 start_codon:yes stop_codon:yes gene_type:complete